MRTTTLAPGASWALPVGPGRPTKDDVPLKWRIAFTELSKQFHRVVAVDYVHGAFSDSRQRKLHIHIYRASDETEPLEYDIVERNGQMFKQDEHGSLWPVYRERAANEPAQPKRARSRLSVDRARRARQRDSEVHEDEYTDKVHSIFCERAEIEEQIKKANDVFICEPNVKNMLALQALRAKLAPIEQRICGAAMFDQMQKDLAS